LLRLGVLAVLVVGLSACSTGANKYVSKPAASATTQFPRPWNFAGCDTLVPAAARELLFTTSAIEMDYRVGGFEMARCEMTGTLVPTPTHVGHLSVTAHRSPRDNDDDAIRRATNGACQDF